MNDDVDGLIARLRQAADAGQPNSLRDMLNDAANTLAELQNFQRDLQHRHDPWAKPYGPSRR